MNWPGVRGHDRNIEIIFRAVEGGRLPHAYLFFGPEGVGKKHFAIELSKALLCKSPRDGEFAACGRCSECILIAAGTHPDVLLERKPEDKLEFPVGQLRELCARLALKPARSDRRIAILDDADDLNEESANCFLKTLEEPPPSSLLILIARDIDRQLPTIRSRCQRLMFCALSNDLLKSMLTDDPQVDQSLIDAVLPMADGSPGVARQLADQQLWQFRTLLLDAMTTDRPDSPAIVKAAMQLVESAGKDAAAQRGRAAILLRMIAGALRQALRQSVDSSIANDPAIAKLRSRLDSAGLLDRLERCLDTETHIQRRVQLSLLIESFVDAMTQPDGCVNFRPAWAI